MDQLKANNRLLSLDVMRGVIMLLLAAESCRVYESLHALHAGGLFNSVITQFFQRFNFPVLKFHFYSTYEISKDIYFLPKGNWKV